MTLLVRGHLKHVLSLLSQVDYLQPIEKLHTHTDDVTHLFPNAILICVMLPAAFKLVQE